MARNEVLQIEGKQLTLSNLDKVMYPETAFTKGQAIDYYVRASRFILPHLHNRPLTRKRYPDGVTGEHFYEKNAPRFAPAWIKKATVPRKNGPGQTQFILANDLPTLVWLANLASLELHVLLSKTPNVQNPTAIVFDLDPGPPADFLACAQVALLLRDALAAMDLKSWIKSSGSKGLQLYVPLNRKVTYGQTSPLAKNLAEALQKAEPALIVSKMSKALRAGKVFIDWSQNSDHKTTVCVYSLRAKRNSPFVSFPIRWETLEKALRERDDSPFLVTPGQALESLEKHGDQFASVLTLKQKFPSAKKIQTALAVIARGPKSNPNRLKGVGNRSIQAYQANRDFTKTREPAPGSAAKTKKSFVIQKHAASRLHYDFRLAMDGVLKSWAVPKGPPFAKGERRLAMHVEDHPLEYRDFEGVIAPGNYGAGSVMIWDHGAYELLDGSMAEGKLHVHLRGKKLNGEWILVKGRQQDNSGEPWFLIKSGEGMNSLSKKDDDTSAVTGRTMKEIADAQGPEWPSNRPTRARRAPRK